nr:MAG TPA: hypothetical protein [Caudoviricetes sp.]
MNLINQGLSQIYWTFLASFLMRRPLYIFLHLEYSLRPIYDERTVTFGHNVLLGF